MKLSNAEMQEIDTILEKYCNTKEALCHFYCLCKNIEIEHSKCRKMAKNQLTIHK